MKSEVFLKEHLGDYFKQDLYIAPEIPDKKLVNAASKIANGIDANYVLAIIDSTLFGSAKDGIVFTGDSVYIKNGISHYDLIQFKYDQLKSAKYLEERWQDKDDKEQVRQTITVELVDQDQPVVLVANSDLMEPMARLLTDISTEVDEAETTEQLLQLNDLSQAAISAYLELIVNFLKRDGILDESEYANLAGLLGTTEVDDKTKDDLMAYRLEPKQVHDDGELLTILKTEVPLGSQTTIFQSLINNLLGMMTSDDKDQWKQIPEFINIQHQLEVTDEQVDFFLKKQVQDQEIIKQRLNDKHASKIQNQLVSLGTGAGASLAALGVTGLAVGAFGELGMGMLAFATMSTGGLALAAVGIGAAGIAGYQGIQKLSNGNTVEKSDIRQSLLQKTVTRQSAAMTLLMGDINYITDRIDQLVNTQDFANQKDAAMADQIDKLRQFIRQLQAAKNASATAKASQGDGERELVMADLPDALNIEKLEDLLAQSKYATKFGEILEGCYHFRDGDNQLDRTVGLRYLKAASQILTQIGYYKVATAANVKNIGKKGLAFLSDKLS
ncbi:hypothetical protein ACFP3T_08295 [Lactiplantibacillus dongliensis]|uniref:Uncharacterized protein n=1 Tax=Lactiplantibacillus dongliensis TaxID=2559919 RepID=A0ABW1R468_9LACO|nr:hypothetical protein [Lactiplantibacillus dongliensis]